ncbi:DNA-binding transcriptional LysR family regulator [Pseudorhizobium tarimense]|uniref:DNA-binding transcriptional LysR family regulator n=1 Tax=Pseudorhizobium tarimense TaxID=1079109 RepID=A0ABV2HBH8_9HYPH|nr:LysR substrate-binding domain-containing protein [Pseudorhizobium tarimense]MCJ8520942.1 LysR substrate-binding domain-containing protein [Pseudorhizobium tarimense]
MSVPTLPNLRHLRALSLTARHSSVNRAAAEICLSQPAVTQAITKLEAELGTFLFERTSSGMFVSDFGTIIINRVDRALEILGKAIVAASGGSPDSPPRDPLRHITTAQLRALMAFKDCGSFESAANALSISLLSMQRTVAALERVVGAKLLLRSGRVLLPSAAGEILARGAKLAAREIEVGTEELENLRGYKTGRIVIGSMPLARVDLVPHAVTSLLRSFPDISVRITEGPYASLIAALRSGDSDMVVGALRNTETYKDIEERLLFDDALSVVVRSAHPLCRYESLSLADTIGYPWVVPPTGTPTRDIFHKAFRSRALMEPKRLVEVSSSVSLRAFLVESDRIAFVSRRQLHYEEHQGLVKVLPIDLPEAHRPIGVMLRRDWKPSAAQSDLLTLLNAPKGAADSHSQVISPVAVRRTRTGTSLAQG